MSRGSLPICGGGSPMRSTVNGRSYPVTGAAGDDDDYTYGLAVSP